ncbi:amidase [Colletotrichum fioriniae PJ7]|uniref:Amidase n=1 Tax=Colletotrichum fioriniae PJ7 TaxID=1445577 RepID=A0A010RMT2_9PEZI|nr:amidase [Colletotrichum fioriniae PJ7]
MLWSLLLKATICLIWPSLEWTTCGQKPASTIPSLLDATLDDLNHGLNSGIFTSVDLVNAYIERIKETTPTLNAVTEINPDAVSIAETLDLIRRQGGPLLGPLHGIPVLIKDNIATADKMNNTAGSYVLLGAKVSEDSTVAAKLRKAGAILLGKAHLSQWAECRSSNSSNGWSTYGGQTLGAYYPFQDPSGSSGGSGVASSVGLAWASLGTETAGSILLPSDVNNVVGIKPTLGLTSRYLVVPISEHQDVVGPIARTVKDAAHLLAAIAGVDPSDNYTSTFPFPKTPDYAAACVQGGLLGKRLGIPRHVLQDPQDAPPSNYSVTVFDSAVDILRSAGAEIIDDIVLPGYNMTEISALLTKSLHADFAVAIEKYFGKLAYNPYNITTLRELRDWTQHDPREQWPEKNTLSWDNNLAEGLRNTDPEFWDVHLRLLYLTGPQGYTGALKNHSLDAIVLPTAFAVMNAAVSGTPVISVPFGRHPDDTDIVKDKTGTLNAVAPNLPFGIGFVGAPFSEETLISIAYAFEQKVQARELNAEPRWKADSNCDMNVVLQDRLAVNDDAKLSPRVVSGNLVPLTVIKGAGHEYIPLPEGENATVADFHSIRTNTKDSPAHFTSGFYKIVAGPARPAHYNFEETKYVLNGQIDILDEATGITHHLVPGDFAFFHVGSKVKFSTKSEGLAFYAVTRPVRVPHPNLKGREEDAKSKL